ncbi:aldo/keto reductase [Uliginosibacterium sp. sgz301328]|uniref:aldo/keto reductase n=1 Tax=Uliginosibacterium sp. sgz301328 TaxID=3243764 RepID=UPI00359D56C8
MTTRNVQLPDGTSVPAIGQGTWYMGDDAGARGQEVRALQLGIDLGLTLIDTAEMYADGGAEKVVGEAIAGRRDSVFVVSKVYPHHASRSKMSLACDASLRRLGTDYIDLYLLHWRGSVPLAETIDAMERLVDTGKILRWGVSNLDTDDMRELWRAGGDACATDQVLYHAASRGIEFDLLPWCREHALPVMAYCPLAQAGNLREDLLGHPDIVGIADEIGATPAQVALAWVIRQGDVIAIPKAARDAHVRENAGAAAIALDPHHLARIDAAFPPPVSREPLDVV